MKAKDYVEKYKPLFEEINNKYITMRKENPTMDIDKLLGKYDEEQTTLVTKLVQEYLKESIELKTTRHVSTLSATFSIWEELNKKWNVMVNLCPEMKLKENGFMMLIANRVATDTKQYGSIIDYKFEEFFKKNGIVRN